MNSIPLKQQLKHGMFVETDNGRYGVVCLKDATDENCIKFLYDPALLIDHGYIYKGNYGDDIVSLDEFDDNLQIIDPDYPGFFMWGIVRIFTLEKYWEADNAKERQTKRLYTEDEESPYDNFVLKLNEKQVHERYDKVYKRANVARWNTFESWFDDMYGHLTWEFIE